MNAEIKEKLTKRISLINLLLSLETKPESNSKEDILLAESYQRGSDSRLKQEKKFIEELLNEIDVLF